MSSTVSINKHYFDQWTDDMYKYLISFNQIKRGTSSHFPETEGKKYICIKRNKKNTSNVFIFKSNYFESVYF